jgi:hypothetical protein
LSRDNGAISWNFKPNVYCSGYSELIRANITESTRERKEVEAAEPSVFILCFPAR